jgi:uncharacterized repeat protein (TIGR03803 family)
VTPAGDLTVLWDFRANQTGALDGSNPTAAPIEGANGIFYGTTYTGVSSNSTAYSVTSDGTYTTLHTFTGSDGQNIYGGLVQGTDGYFYGVADLGGANNLGVIFLMTPSGDVTVLHSFAGAPDGSQAHSQLIQASDGNFYGVTISGGTYNNGTIFKLTPSGDYSIIYSLNYSNGDGEGPSSALIQATNGLLYGVTGSVNSGNYGTIYSVSTTGTFTTLYSFTDGPDGDNPEAPLIQNTNGLLYGSAISGGDFSSCGGHGCGVLFSLDVGLGPFVSLVSKSGKQGAEIGILGQGFTSSSVVKFDGLAAATPTLEGTTFLTATVPAGARTGNVTVTTGATTLTSNTAFNVRPTLASFSPPSGPVGTPVVLTGTGLTQTRKVTFGGVEATVVTVNSDPQVTADVPVGAVTGTIIITTKGGRALSTTDFTVN